MTQQLPAPLVPATCDLRSLPYMPLHVARLRDSETSVVTKGDEFRCALLLWSASWHQLPAASLPDDDLLLADLAGFGRVVKEWRKVKAGALRGFVKCSDGRLYHKVVAEVAIDSWGSMLQQRHGTYCSALKKRQQRAKQPVDLPSFSLWITETCPLAKPYLSRWTRRHGPEDTEPASSGHPPTCPEENASNRSEVKVSINQHHGDGSRGAHVETGSTPGPKARNPNPPTVAGDTPWQARIRAQGWEKGLQPRSNESWEDFGERVRTTKSAA